MKSKDKNNSVAEELRGIEKRRKVLKKMSVATGVVSAVGASTQWTKPIVNAVLSPVHAQTSAPLGDISAAAWFLGDDAPGGYDTGITDVTTVTDAFLYDDSSDMQIRATLNPPANVAVTATFDFGSTTFGALDSPLPTPMATADNGSVDFGTFGPTNSDFGDTPGNGTITLTLSASGYNSKTIILSVS